MLRFDVVVERGAFTLEAQADIDAPAAGLFGPSGAGKTTLLHAIAGLARPRHGRIEIAGETVFDSAAGVCLPPHRRRLGVVFQDDRLLPHLSVAGNLRFARRFARTPDARPIDEIVRMLDLRDLLDRAPATLSGGERRRVALARALACAPRMLLLDEPTAGLDLERRREVIPMLQRVRDSAGVPMLIVSHDLEEILQLASVVTLIEAGRVRGVGTLHDLTRQDPSLRALAGAGIVSVVPMRVLDADARAVRLVGGRDDALSLIALPGPWTVGDRISVGLRAEDVALSKHPVDGVSVRNQIHARVTGARQCDGRVVVELDAGAPLLSLVSESARDALGIEPGVPLQCLIKASAVRLLGRRDSP